MRNNKINPKSIEAFSREIMGVEEFEMLARYFVSIFSIAVQKKREKKPFFVVFITRRCYVLFQVFERVFKERDTQGTRAWERLRSLCPEAVALGLEWKDCAELIRYHFITDINLLTQSRSIAQYFANTGVFPSLVVCDELLIHGRTINSFLNEFEKELLKNLQLIGQEETLPLQLKLGEKLIQALQLYVYARNDGVMLLLPRYCSALHVFRKQMDKNKWRALSMYFSRLISASPVNNAAYAWNFGEKLTDQSVKLPYPVNGFECCETEIYKGFRQTTFVMMYDRGHGTQAICTVRAKESLNLYQRHIHRMFVPYILYDRVSYKNVMRLHFTLCEDIRRDASLNDRQKAAILSFLTQRDAIREPEDIRQNRISYQWLAQTNELLLSCLLMREYLRASQYSNDAASEWMARHVDMEALVRNYMRMDGAELKANPDETAWDLKAIFYWRPREDAFRRYLDLLTEGAQPFWMGEKFGNGTPKKEDFCKDTVAADAVLDVIANLGHEVERDAYEYGSANVFFDESALKAWNRPFSMGRLLKECQRAFESPVRTGDSAATLTQVTALIVQAMDLGLIGMNVALQNGDQAGTGLGGEVYTQVKAGEQALFIHPIRYAQMNSTLRMIEEKCDDLQDLLELEVFLFAKAVQKRFPGQETQNLAGRLRKYMDDLRDSGQTLSEWELVSQESSMEVQLEVAERVHALLNRLEYEGIYRTM